MKSEPKQFQRQIKSIVEQCRVSVGLRQQQAQAISSWMFVSSGEDGPALYNKIPPHIDKLASSIFCPVDPRFDIEYENPYGQDELRKAQIAARWLTREFSRRDLDMLFGSAVEGALEYGSYFIKLLWGHDGLGARLMAPWQFGVYVESNTEIDGQEALCETSYITAEELWRRIAHRADAKELYRRATAHAKKGARDDSMPAGLHNVLPPAAIGTGETTDQTSSGGGIVDVASAPMMPVMAPEVAASLLEAHELYLVNDETGDYTTIQLVEPDIIIAPRMLRKNLFVPFSHPYIHVQINPQENYFWGRSEASDLIPLQRLLSARLLDVKKIMSLQYRRIRAFYGFSDMNDERYDQLIESGWIAQEQPGAKVDDITPPMPAQWKEELATITQMFDDIAGMDKALSGGGEPGIRSGNHFQGAVRMASPRLRDRSLRAERQYAAFGEKALWLCAAKDARAHWLDPNDLAGNTDFALSQLSDDARVVVHVHSASPIYEQDHANLVAFGLQTGMLDADDGLSLLPFPNRDILRDKLQHREAAKQKLISELPPQERAAALLGIKPPEGHGKGHH